jgi:hypothetical protein
MDKKERYGICVDIYCAAGIEVALNEECQMELNEGKRQQVLFYFTNPKADELKEKYRKGLLEVNVRDLRRRLIDIRDRIDEIIVRERR